jgi:hypothetical protein
MIVCEVGRWAGVCCCLRLVVTVTGIIIVIIGEIVRWVFFRSVVIILVRRGEDVSRVSSIKSWVVVDVLAKM